MKITIYHLEHVDFPYDVTEFDVLTITEARALMARNTENNYYTIISVSNYKDLTPTAARRIKMILDNFCQPCTEAECEAYGFWEREKHLHMA